MPRFIDSRNNPSGRTALHWQEELPEIMHAFISSLVIKPIRTRRATAASDLLQLCRLSIKKQIGVLEQFMKRPIQNDRVLWNKSPHRLAVGGHLSKTSTPPVVCVPENRGPQPLKENMPFFLASVFVRASLRGHPVVPAAGPPKDPGAIYQVQTWTLMGGCIVPVCLRPTNQSPSSLHFP